MSLTENKKGKNQPVVPGSSTLLDSTMKNKRKSPGKQGTKKERDCEDWCFVCKDGGELILCDYPDCPKVYHLDCVRKDDSFPETGENWECDRHSCSICRRKDPKLNCYCCPNAVCGGCVSAAEFLPVKKKEGLCNECLELVQVVEEKDPMDADGHELDLTDRNTYECLFLEYWEIMKDEEGLVLDDVYAAEARLKKHSKCSSKSKKIGKGKKDCKQVTSDSGMDNSDDHQKVGKRMGSKALEYVGWGSKPLVEFLEYLGKDPTKELSQYEVDSIICAYARERRLFDPEKKKKIICDDRLYPIFRRKSLYRNAIYTLLEAHLVTNLEKSEEDEDNDVETSFQDKNGKTTITSKRYRTIGSHGESQETEGVQLYESGFASVVAENIKLVYLRRSLVEELLKEPESFEAKIVGSFVKVKNDPRECSHRNALGQLLQVTGIKQVSKVGENKTESVLIVSNLPTDVHIFRLSDLDFCEEEMGDLREKVEKGSHPKPTVVDLELKAKHLHVDITKHWIEKELVRLRRHIDRANEKGWRGEFYEYLEQMEQLKKPSEQQRLLQESPKVIPEMVEHEQVSEIDEGYDGSPKSTLKSPHS